MSLVKDHPWRFRAALIGLNVLGILWIHHDLTSTPKPRLRVLEALPARDIDKADRFSLVFDEPLQLKTSMGAAMVRSPFAIKPQPAGRWVWSEPTRLDFVLDKPLPPGRVFTIRPASDLESQTGRTLVGASEFRFETRALTFLGCSLKTADRQDVTLELRFDQPVDPADLLRHVRLTDAKSHAPLEAVCITREPSGLLVLRMPRPRSNAVRVRVDAKLTGSGADLGLRSPVEQDIPVDELFRLRRAVVDPPGAEVDIAVDLHFSKDLDTRKPLPKVDVVPRVEGLRVSYSQEESVLRMKGRFTSGLRYTATVSSNIVSEHGEALGESQSATFTVPDRRPTIHFEHDSGILSPQGNLLLDLTVVNCGGLEIGASRVHANNLLAHLRNAEADATSRQQVEKTIPLKLVQNEPARHALDLKQLIREPLGIYHVHVAATDRTWTADSTIVAVTDLGITCKQERDGLLVWITSLSKAEPMASVRVSAISYNNQPLASAVTGPDGIARLAAPDNHPDGKPWVVVAEKGNDLSYLLPERRLWVVDEADSSGREIPRTYDVMLYTERGVYRPGDTVLLTGIVRDSAGQTPPSFPLSIKVKRPDGRIVATLPVRHDAQQQGFFQTAFQTDQRGQTGPYRFIASLPGASEALGQTQAFVEAFMPVRIEVRAEPTQSRFGPKEDVEIRTRVRYLFGKPAAGLNAVAEGAFRREAFRSERFRDYTFTPPKEGERLEIDAPNDVTDDHGEAVLEVDSPNEGSPGWWRGTLALTVHEEGGRSVSRNITVWADTAGRHIGLRLPSGRMAPVAQPFNIEWIQVTGDGQLAPPGPMKYTLARVEYDATLEKVDGRPVWKSTERLIPVSQGDIGKAPEASAKGMLPATCPKPGLYRLSLSDNLSGGNTSQVDFYACEGDDQAQSVAMERPERLEIVLDREKYAPGAKAKVLVRSPFEGRMLLTVETDRVIDSKVVPMKGNTAEVTLDISGAIRGGAFLTATVVRAVNPADAKWLPHRAMGLARLLIDHSGRSIPVVIEALGKAEPGDGLTVSVRTAKPSDPNHPGVIHLWAVDEGILLTTDFSTPDPLAHFFASRRAAVLSSDLFFDLMPDYRRPAGMARIGADGWEGDADALRRPPEPARRRESAVLWNEVFPLNPDGTACARMVMPQLTGELRLMAVVVDGDRYGRGQRAVTLTSPLLVETSWPRFVAPGDRFKTPIKLFNSTASALPVDLKLKVEGPVVIDNPSDFGRVTVDPKAPKVLWVSARATETGPLTVGVEATATDPFGTRLTARAKAELVVRPASTLHAESKLVRLEAGKSIRLDVPPDFLRETVETRVRVGNLPTVHLQPYLEELIDYPYGCVEQTTSQLYAMLYAPDLLKEGPGGKAAARDVEAMIAAGISRLWSMQTRSGGLSYWPGAAVADPWGSTYAAGFLAQARRTGRKLDVPCVDELLKYIEKLFLETDSRHDKPDINTQALICRVLAAFDRPQLGWMSRLSEQAPQLDMAGRAHLALAWGAVGRKDRANTVLLDDSISQRVATTTGGRLTSQVQQEAVLLDALLELDPRHEWVPALVERLEKARSEGRWGSTLDKAAAIAALSRYQTTAKNDGAFQGSLRVGDQKIAAFDHTRPLTALLRDRQGAGIFVDSSGTGTIYLAVTTRGLRKSSSNLQYDRQLCVRRRWLGAEDKPIGKNALHVGDLVRVEVEISRVQTTEKTTVENVAIVDALPGGMEVENPRLATSSGTGRHGEAPDRVEFLDDRVVLFCSVGSTRRVFRYALRVVTPGTFVVPPVEASCMYDVAFASINGGGEVTIQP